MYVHRYECARICIRNVGCNANGAAAATLSKQQQKNRKNENKIQAKKIAGKSIVEIAQ